MRLSTVRLPAKRDAGSRPSAALGGQIVPTVTHCSSGMPAPGLALRRLLGCASRPGSCEFERKRVPGSTEPPVGLSVSRISGLELPERGLSESAFVELNKADEWRDSERKEARLPTHRRLRERARRVRVSRHPTPPYPRKA